MNYDTMHRAKYLLANGGSKDEFKDLLRSFVDFFDPDKMYTVLADARSENNVSIVGRYQYRFEAEWMAEGWNRVNFGHSEYSVGEPGDY